MKMDTVTVTKPVLRYHGGKWRLASWIISHFPAHRVYVEPFGGAASVLMQKPRSNAEVYNDLDGEIVNVFRVLQCPEKRARLCEMLHFTPYARAEFMLAWEHTDDPVEAARRVIIRAQMGFGSAGATRGSTGFRANARTKNRYTNEVTDWLKYQDALPACIERLRHVQIENKPALEVIDINDADDTLFYIDPPYVLDTRVMRGSYYRHEMSNAEHSELLDRLNQVQGMVVLNGYQSDFYDAALRGWNKYTKPSRASAYRGTALRTEVVWINKACANALAQQEIQQRLIA